MPLSQSFATQFDLELTLQPAKAWTYKPPTSSSKVSGITGLSSTDIFMSYEKNHALQYLQTKKIISIPERFWLGALIMHIRRGCTLEKIKFSLEFHELSYTWNQPIHMQRQVSPIPSRLTCKSLVSNTNAEPMSISVKALKCLPSHPRFTALQTGNNYTYKSYTFSGIRLGIILD